MDEIRPQLTELGYGRASVHPRPLLRASLLVLRLLDRRPEAHSRGRICEYGLGGARHAATEFRRVG